MAAIVDDLIGVPQTKAAKILDVTEGRLRGWRYNELLEPSILQRSEQRTTAAVYSLDDLVAGRVIRELEAHGVHIRRIRQAVEYYRSPSHPTPLTSLQWGTGNDGHVYVSFNDDDWLAGEKPDHYVLAGALDLERIRGEARDAALSRLGTPGRLVEIRGKLVFDGTRISVKRIKDYIDANFSDDEIIDRFPRLTAADIDAVRAA